MYRLIAKKFGSFLLVFSLFFAATSQATRQPIVKDGQYFYSEQDTYKHIDVWRALKIVTARIFSLQTWKEKFFSSSKPVDANDPDVGHLLPQSIQSVPPHRAYDEPVITWIGHASFLIQIGGFNILTDPIFGDIKVGPYWTLATRTMKPGIKFKDLPPIHAIVISHNHSDHTDTDSLMALAKNHRPQVLVPEGNRELFESMGFESDQVREYSWGGQGTLSTCEIDLTDDGIKMIDGSRSQITLTFLPAFHWSIRFSLASYRKSLWGGWMISHKNTNIFFAGDTAYGDHFKEIAQEFPSIDVVLMPIGPTEKECACNHNPHKEYHVDAREALEGFKDLNARCFIPMHYATFGGKDHQIYPIYFLDTLWKENAEAFKDKHLLVAQCGRAYNVATLQPVATEQ